ncbi:MAG: hypothetical protein NVV74_21410 [Magnetospirillum sp.]|nr:hypothetical protein [Magnetospirillum sp.]
MSIMPMNDPFDASTPRRPSSWFGDDFFSLGVAVGPDQPNRREDVIKVETILGNTGHHDLSRTDGPLGYWGGAPGKRGEVLAGGERVEGGRPAQTGWPHYHQPEEGGRRPAGRLHATDAG